MIRKYLFLILVIAFPFLLCAENDNSTKKERNYIREGNSMFNKKRYGDAEKLYQKALQENEHSPIAKFNLATTYLRQTTTTDTTKNSLLEQACKMLDEVAHIGNNKLASKALYDLGNISYNQKEFDKSIEYYKEALRKNPNDDDARQNLRMAQLQLKKQQNNQNNKDNQKNNKDNNKQNQDQNKEKNNNGQDQQKQNPNQNKQPQQPPKGGMSKENADQILQTMQNEEKNTQDKINRAKMQQMQRSRRTGKQW